MVKGGISAHSNLASELRKTLPDILNAIKTHERPANADSATEIKSLLKEIQVAVNVRQKQKQQQPVPPTKGQSVGEPIINQSSSHVPSPATVTATDAFHPPRADVLSAAAVTATKKRSNTTSSVVSQASTTATPCERRHQKSPQQNAVISVTTVASFPSLTLTPSSSQT